MVEGLLLAARTARLQAGIARVHGHGAQADTMCAFADTLDAMALAWPDEAPTDPDIEYVVVPIDEAPRPLTSGLPRAYKHVCQSK